MQSPNDRVVYSKKSTPTTTDFLVNSSIVDDRYRYSHRLSNDTKLKNNYAPLNVMMKDTIPTRNINPVARYIATSTPYYHNIGYNDKVLYEVASRTNKHANDIELDMVRLNGISRKRRIFWSRCQPLR